MYSHDCFSYCSHPAPLIAGASAICIVGRYRMLPPGSVCMHPSDFCGGHRIEGGRQKRTYVEQFLNDISGAGGARIAWRRMSVTALQRFSRTNV